MAGSKARKETLQCICHDECVSDKLVRAFTESTWESFLKSVGIWSDLVGNRAELAKSFVTQHGGFRDIAIPHDAGNHERCYKYFTDASKQYRGLIAKQKQDAATPSVAGMFPLIFKLPKA